jgi:hypothetical protein
MASIDHNSYELGSEQFIKIRALLRISQWPVHIGASEDPHMYDESRDCRIDPRNFCLKASTQPGHSSLNFVARRL